MDLYNVCIAFSLMEEGKKNVYSFALFIPSSAIRSKTKALAFC